MSSLDRSFLCESPVRFSTPSPNHKFNGIPSAFGEKTYISREDHEKERSKWVGKMEEIQKKLIDSETLNSEMLIKKASLKKKMVEMDKKQKPLMEANRKLGDRNKMLQQEVKKVEQRFCHSRDDFLTLKDAHERLLKENAILKEKRVSPEKLEELMRYRNKVLEYSKCITALRSSAYEKDKRYEMLVQKFKRLQKCLKKSDNDDDGMSNNGSDCSAASTVSLDTITEDFEEAFAKDIETNYQALYRENAELQRALNELQLNTSDLNEENFLRDQISFAHSTIEQQQLVIDSTQEMMSQTAQLKSTIANQLDHIRSLDQTIEDLKQQIATQTDRNDLLEFQMLEMEENFKLQELGTRTSLEEVNIQTKKELEDLKISNAETIAKYDEDLKKLRSQLEKFESQEINDAKNKSLKEAEETNSRLNEEFRSLSKELGKLRFQLQGKENDLNRERKMTEALSSQLQTLVSSSQEEACKNEEKFKQLKQTIDEQNEKIVELQNDKETILKKLNLVETEYAAYKEEQRPEIRTELERRFEESRYRLKEAFEKIHDYELLYEAAKNSGKSENNNEALVEELNEVKEFNAHLERQFQTQSNIIEALKTKVLQHRSFSEKINKLSELEDSSRVQEELIMFSRENNCDDSKLAANIALIIKEVRKNSFYSPLEITTNHHKIRPYSSVESSTEWQSNSSEGIVSPDENDE